MTKSILAVAASSLMLVLATPSAAQDAPSATVSYGDLNLRTDSGVAQFDRRIRSAVIGVCGGPAPANLLFGRLVRLCQAETMADVTPNRDEAIRIARSGKTGSVKVAKLTIKAPRKN